MKYTHIILSLTDGTYAERKIPSYLPAVMQYAWAVREWKRLRAKDKSIESWDWKKVSDEEE